MEIPLPIDFNVVIGDKEPICNILFPDFLTTNLVKQFFNILLENFFLLSYFSYFFSSFLECH